MNLFLLRPFTVPLPLKRYRDRLFHTVTHRDSPLHTVTPTLLNVTHRLSSFLNVFSPCSTQATFIQSKSFDNVSLVCVKVRFFQMTLSD